jgi:hypothetical protein
LQLFRLGCHPGHLIRRFFWTWSTCFSGLDSLFFRSSIPYVGAHIKLDLNLLLFPFYD